MAIGWLYYVGHQTQPFCTGTLIAPDLVVTARHCVNGIAAGEIGFGVGTYPTDGAAHFVSAGVFPNTQADAALIRLAQSVSDSGLHITPIEVNQTAVDPSIVGEPAQAGGYGDTYDEARTGRWFATVYVYDVAATEIVVDGRGEQGICYGDSGSGLIRLDADNNPVVLAVESWGDASCVDIDHLTRLDPIYDWIAPILAGEDPPDPCAGVTSTGRCVDNVAETCRNYTLRQIDCTALGTECMYIDSERGAGYGCVCVDLTEAGRCDNDVLESCRNSRVSLANCAASGRTCGYDTLRARYSCLETAVCRPEDEAGRCEGNTAIRCADGRTTREICTVAGYVCAADENGARCRDPNLPPDAGTAEAGAEDAASAGGVLEGGCGCRADSNGSNAIALGGLLLLARRRMRRG
ncbi:MAG: S1 family peptidase [Deltaproteobacteria bacterium]|nr:S1 family peptidase [Deltaproteobacteria bacterium]